MSTLILDFTDDKQLILKKDKTGSVEISYRKFAEQEVGIGSLSYSNITLLEAFLAIEKFPSVAVPSPQPTESGEYLQELLRIMEKHLAKVVDKQPAESAGQTKADSKKAQK